LGHALRGRRPLDSAQYRSGGEPDAGGYRVVVVPAGSLWPTSSDMLRFGVDAEVPEPPELRNLMNEIVGMLRQTYSNQAELP
jgi:hypothetical protein